MADQRFGAREVRYRLQARSALGEDHRMRGGKIGGERFKGGHTVNGITSIAIRKLKASADRCGAARLLWVSPVDAGQQISELRR